MGRRWPAVTAVFAVVALGASPPAGGEPFDGLVVARGPILLTEEDDGATGSIAVTNPTSADITVQAAEPDAEHLCPVDVTGEETIRRGTSATLSVSVSAATGTGCDEPAEDAGELVLLASAEGATGAPQRIERSTAPAAAAEEPEVKPTGVELPTDTVFLRRSGSRLKGSFVVLNTTSETVEVTPSKLRKDCGVDPARLSDSGTEVESGDARTIRLNVTAACEELEAETIQLTVLLSTADGEKYDYGTLALESRVDWSWAWLVVIGIAQLALLVAAFGGFRGLQAANADPRKPPGDLTWGAPLVASADTPKSWLTAIATVGPAATALFTTTDLLEGLTGIDPTAPATRVVVGTAVALALVGFATLLANTPAVTVVGDDGKPQECPTVGHFVLAAALTVVSAGIGLVSVWAAAAALDLPGPDLATHGVAIVSAGALLYYAYWSVKRYVFLFVQKTPDAPPPSRRAPKPSGSAANAVETADTGGTMTSKAQRVVGASLGRVQPGSIAAAEAETALGRAGEAATLAAELANDDPTSQASLVQSVIACQEASAAIRAIRRAVPPNESALLDQEVAEAETVERAVRLLASTPPAPAAPNEGRRPITRFMI